LDELQKKDSIQNYVPETDTVQKLSEIDIKQEIKEECVYLDEEASFLSYKHNSMVWIFSLNLPMINEPDKSELHAVINKISLLSESTDERKGLEKSNKSNGKVFRSHSRSARNCSFGIKCVISIYDFLISIDDLFN